MEDIIIKLENVTKKFKVYKDRPLTLKEKIVKRKRNAYKEFYALNDVSFEVKKGSTLGLIGSNGSGKSTLLKLINRTMFPNSGNIKIKGKIASLIELGAGFHPDLSGRENIYNNATIFGFTREEIDKKVPEIIAFSELEDFIDNALRTYSSGMYARLAFSVAIHVDADILLVDEILGVGDINFQRKCANKIYEMKNNGTTIILVTHDMSTIDRLCDYAVWLDKGCKIAEGEPHKIENLYLKHMAEKQEERKKIELIEKKDENRNYSTNKKNSRVEITHLGEHFGNNDVIFTNYKLLDKKGIERRSFNIGDSIKLVVNYLCQDNPENIEVNIGFEIGSIDKNLIYGTNTSRERYENKKLRLNKEGTFEILIKDLALLPGDYTIGVALTSYDDHICYDQYRVISEFKIYGDIYDEGITKIKHEYILDNQKLDRKK